MGQKHSRPSSSRPQNQEQPLQPQAQQQPSEQQQPPAARQGYAASPVYPQAQLPPGPYGGTFTNGQLYGGYTPNPYGHVHPGGAPVYQPGHYQPPRPTVPTQAVRQTQTIKNQVNLIKKSLKLEPHPEKPNELLLSFAFGATAPCRVSTFVLATEDPGQSLKIIGATSELRTPAYYDKGVNLQFPPNDTLAQQHTIRLVIKGERKEQPLQYHMNNSYPLIIRLEALTQQGAVDGRQLQQVPVGAALPEWVQAQCTYAKLKKDDDGKWALQVLKQKIWVDGVSYELQEIYGMEATRTAGGGGGEDVDGRECVICMSAPRDTTVLPCRHMCLCKGCADALRSQTNKCPICREPMESLLHIKQ